MSGYFSFGKRASGFGRCFGSDSSPSPDPPLHDAMEQTSIEDGTVHLPFHPTEIIGNLHRELYCGEWRRGAVSTLARSYYLVRPLLPVAVRRHLQRMYLRDWKDLSFPRWPVDLSVEDILDELMLLALRASGAGRIPFVWFWPDASSSCAIMTHDVETRSGKEFCGALMDIDESFGIRSSFQIIPEERYTVGPEFLSALRVRGFEIAVHDLNHDGHLYRDREQFLERARKINAYGKMYGAVGFRAGVLYRKQLWYDALNFAYDMSVPNVAHLDPQRGGCCTVMPYFLGNVLELPVTTIQDYSLFHILNDYSISLWKQQTEMIMARHGLMSFIVHPDYIIDRAARDVYLQLLDYLQSLARDRAVWITTPGEVNAWWRQRDAMQVVAAAGGGWRIEGEGSERARLAYASEEDGRLVLRIEQQPEGKSEADLLQSVPTHEKIA